MLEFACVDADRPPGDAKGGQELAGDQSLDRSAAQAQSLRDLVERQERTLCVGCRH
jgi:hypothetical protein